MASSNGFTNFQSSTTLPLMSRPLETKKVNRFAKLLRPGKEKERQLLEQQEFERRQRDQETAEQVAKLKWELERERRKHAEEENARAMTIAQEASRREYENLQKLEREKTVKLREKERQSKEKKKQKMVSAEKLRELRDLIRLRYALDVEIWTLRGVRGPDRPIVEEKMEKADAVLHNIRDTILAWEDTRDSWTEEEWDKLGDVYGRITADGKRWWMEKPPWDGSP
jgi:hypothetical protein